MGLGETWGRAAGKGLVIGLRGELGAGKTQLVKGLARGLGSKAWVHSPTFALVNIYTGGRLTLFHLDLYRLDTPEQILAAGLEEYLYPEGVSVIEWADRWFGPNPAEPALPHGVIGPRGKPVLRTIRWVEMEILSQSERRICYEDLGV